MALSVYDPNMGFRPHGTALKFWVLLPQVTTTIGSEKIPAIYGNLKSLFLPIFMVILLIALEAALVFQLNDEGVGVMALVGLSVFDFVIAIIPVFFFYQTNLYSALVDADLFIIDTKYDVPHTPDGNFENINAYRDDLEEHRKRDNRKKMWIHVIDVFFALVIIGFGYWKFVTYWAVFGNDIFVEAIGRFIVVVILLSVITHIFFTRTVVTYFLFKLALGSQLRAFRRQHRNQIQPAETNARVPLNYHANYSPQKADNLRIAQLYRAPATKEGGETPKEPEDLEIIKQNGSTRKYRVNEFEGNSDIYLIYTGLLNDPDLQKILNGVGDGAAQRAVIATCKSIQTTQFAG